MIKDISRITATRDLTNLVGKGILKMVGIGKRQVHYIMNDSKKMQWWCKNEEPLDNMSQQSGGIFIGHNGHVSDIYQT